MPYLYEGRQHRKITRESLDCAVMLKEMEAMGVHNLITFDAHDPRMQNVVPLRGIENVYHKSGTSKGGTSNKRLLF